jgi:hypothetical protein
MIGETEEEEAEDRNRWKQEDGRNVFKILTDKPTGQRSLGRARQGWEDNIIMNLNEMGVNTRNWIN